MRQMGSPPKLSLTDLAAQIAARVPQEPIRIVGFSIGGHLAYAVALHLQASGREIEGFCAIDAFMVDSSAPGAGWKGRALRSGLEALTKRRLGAFVRTRFWRALLRLAGPQLPSLVRKPCLFRQIAVSFFTRSDIRARAEYASVLEGGRSVGRIA